MTLGFDFPYWLFALIIPLLILLLGFLYNYRKILHISAIEQWKIFRLSMPELSREKRFRMSFLYLLYAVTLTGLILNLAGPHKENNFYDIVFILDNSISMQRKYSDGTTNFDSAFNLIRERGRNTDKCTIFTLKDGAAVRLDYKEFVKLNSVSPTEPSFDIKKFYGLVDHSSKAFFVTDSCEITLPDNIETFEVEKGSPSNVGITSFEISGDKVFLRVVSTIASNVNIGGKEFTLKKGATSLVLPYQSGTIRLETADDLESDNIIDPDKELLLVDYAGDHENELFKLIKSIQWIKLVSDLSSDIHIFDKVKDFKYSMETNNFFNQCLINQFEFGEQKLIQSLNFHKGKFAGSDIAVKGPFMANPIITSNNNSKDLIVIAESEQMEYIIAFGNENNVSILSGIDLNILLTKNQASVILVYEILDSLRKKIKGAVKLISDQEALLKPAFKHTEIKLDPVKVKKSLKDSLLIVNSLLVFLCILFRFFSFN
ncbi:MAG: hypothetical protein HY606_00895 [Planctomycetes bacterium]|nr:hypothetical protein [Planctomycetota bacterium]